MLRKRKRRSREFKKNSQVIDIEEAREERRRKRQEAIPEKKAKRQTTTDKVVSPRQKGKKSRKRALYGLACLLIVGILACSAINIFSLSHQKSELAEENAKLQKERDKLNSQLENSNTPEYIEKEARSQLRLIMPDETLYILPDETATEGAVTDDTVKE